MRAQTWLVVGSFVAMALVGAWCAVHIRGGVRVTTTRDVLVWPTNECGETRDVSARSAIFHVPEETMGTIHSFRYGKDYLCLNVIFDDGRHGYLLDLPDLELDGMALNPLDEELFPIF